MRTSTDAATTLPTWIELTVGGRIVHPRFGHGTVVTLSGDGMGSKARIDFDGSGVKTLLVAHAGLRPAPG